MVDHIHSGLLRHPLHDPIPDRLPGFVALVDWPLNEARPKRCLAAEAAEHMDAVRRRMLAEHDDTEGLTFAIYPVRDVSRLEKLEPSILELLGIRNNTPDWALKYQQLTRRAE